MLTKLHEGLILPVSIHQLFFFIAQNNYCKSHNAFSVLPENLEYKSTKLIPLKDGLQAPNLCLFPFPTLPTCFYNQQHQYIAYRTIHLNG